MEFRRPPPGGDEILALIIAIPAAYRWHFFPGKRTKEHLLIECFQPKMLPAVGV